MDETDSLMKGGVEHGDSGELQPKYSDDQIVRALCEFHPEPVTVKELAAAVGCHENTASNRLDTLTGEGRVQTKKVGARARVYWTDTAGAPAAALIDRLERPALVSVAGWFEPDFNASRTSTARLREFLRDQDSVLVSHVIDHVDGGANGA